MEMLPSEVFDRYTILHLKARYSSEARQELERYEEWVASYGDGHATAATFVVLLPWIVDLATANGAIWSLEASLRKENPNDPNASGALTLEEIGRRALLIREWNRKRVEAKNAINVYTGYEADIKVLHASATVEQQRFQEHLARETHGSEHCHVAESSGMASSPQAPSPDSNI